MAVNFDNTSKDSSGSEPFEIAHDEYVIKDYYAANIKKPVKGQAHVALTNKRAMIYYSTKQGILVNDAQISEVTATNFFWGKRKRRKAGLIALGMGIIGYLVVMIMFLPSAMNSNSYSYYDSYDDAYYTYYDNSLRQAALIQIAIFGTLLAIPVIVGVYLVFKERFTFVITMYVKSVTGAISLHNYPRPGRLEGLLSPDQLKIEGKPGPDAEIMTKEIGALILDIQRGIINK